MNLFDRNVIIVIISSVFFIGDFNFPVKSATNTDPGPIVDCTDEQLARCAHEVVSGIGWEVQIIKMNRTDFDYLCKWRQQIQNCVADLTKICRVPYSYNGLMDAYHFFCNKYKNGKDYMDFKSFFWSIPSSGYQCFGRYPQLLSEFLEYLNLRPSNSFIINSGLLYSDMYVPHSEIIYHEACIHLSVSRDLYCKEFLITVLDGTESADWYMAFNERLHQNKMGIFKYAFYRDYYSRIDLRNCSLMRDKPAVEACMLTKKCIEVLDPLARYTQYGIFVFSDNEIELDNMCRMTPNEFDECIDKLVARCSPYALSIYRAMGAIRMLMCGEEGAKYTKHKNCLKEVKTSSFFYQTSKCSEKLLEEHKEIMRHVERYKKDDLSTAACNTGADFLDCNYIQLMNICFLDAAYWQRMMSRLSLAAAFTDLYCYNVFSHTDPKKSTFRGGACTRSMAVTVWMSCFILMMIAMEGRTHS